MDPYGVCGYLFLCSFYPSQIYRVLKRKSAGDFSPFSLSVMVTGLVLLQISMVVYGGYLVYQIGNGISLVGSAILLILRYVYSD